MNNKFINYTSFVGYILLFMAVGIFSSCAEEPLPEEGSIADLTPPSASFSYTADPADYLTLNFANLSNSATDYNWAFGNGEVSVDKNPTVTYPGPGEYEISLTASDKLNVSNTSTRTITLVEPIITFTPIIKNPSFDIQGEDDYRDDWRNGDLGGVIQVTSSPIHTPEKAAKLPAGGDRIGYQLFTVEAETEYTLSFYYTMKTANPGVLTVRMLGGEVTNPDNIESATLAKVDLTDQESASIYVPATLVFNSGTFTEVALFFSNVGEECRIDTFSIEAN